MQTAFSFHQSAPNLSLCIHTWKWECLLVYVSYLASFCMPFWGEEVRQAIPSQNQNNIWYYMMVIWFCDGTACLVLVCFWVFVCSFILVFLLIFASNHFQNWTCMVQYHKGSLLYFWERGFMNMSVFLFCWVKHFRFCHSGGMHLLFLRCLLLCQFSLA